MKLSTVVALATSVAVTLVDAQQPVSGFVPVTGADTGVVRRLPVQWLASERPDIFNMYILALLGMQYDKAETDPVSFYQVSAIHGIPFIPWQETSVSTQDPTRGYCTHNSPLFATWHRPYLALMEQRIVKHAIYEASKFRGPDAARWQAAARNVRLPYWDWAASDLQSREPAQLKSTTVTVTRPGTNGVPYQSTIANPLYEYRFSNAQLRTQYFRNQFQTATVTRRQPPNAQLTSSNNAAVDSAMFSGYSSRRSAVFGLFTIPSFNEFSNTQRALNGQPNGWNSVESLHNTVHVNAGGQYGHMTAVPYSAFDPIFWLHHVNVDRLIAMYQAVYPSRKLTAQPATGTFNRRVTSSSVDDMNTPLAPFRKAAGNYFTSNDVSTASSIWNLGYSYTEVPDTYRNNPTGLSAFTTSQINALYRPNTASRKRDSGFKRREWICHMTFDANEVAGSANVDIYFDNTEAPVTGPTAYPTASVSGYIPRPSEHPKYYNGTAPAGGSSESGYYVGSAGSFHYPSEGHKMPMDITGAVYLTDSLIEAGCPSLNPSDVVPFLKKNLKWIVKLGGQEVVPLTEVPSLKVGVSSSDVEYPEDTQQLPQYGEFETHYDVTEKKKCGFTKDDENLVDSRPAPVYDDNGVPQSPELPDEPAHTDEPVYEPVKTDAPVYESAKPDAPVYESVKPDEPVYKPVKTDAPVYEPSKSDAPVYKPVKTDEPVYVTGKPVRKPTTIHVTVTTTICPATCKQSAPTVMPAYGSY